MNKEDIINWLESKKITDYVINDDNSIDTFSSVNLPYKPLKILPVTFRRVEGDFNIFAVGQSSVTYTTNYTATCGTGGPFSYDLHASAEKTQ